MLLRSSKQREPGACISIALGILAAMPCSVGVSVAADSAYPIRPVRVVVSNAPGSSPEITGRLVANKLSAQMGRQFVIDTRPGASGIIGVELVKSAAPDAYTLLIGRAFAQYIREERNRIAGLAQSAGIRID